MPAPRHPPPGPHAEALVCSPNYSLQGEGLGAHCDSSNFQSRNAPQPLQSTHLHYVGLPTTREFSSGNKLAVLEGWLRSLFSSEPPVKEQFRLHGKLVCFPKSLWFPGVGQSCSHACELYRDPGHLAAHPALAPLLTAPSDLSSLHSLPADASLAAGSSPLWPHHRLLLYPVEHKVLGEERGLCLLRQQRSPEQVRACTMRQAPGPSKGPSSLRWQL